MPRSVKAALVRWYTGGGSEADHRASVIMIVKARSYRQWLACDCLESDAAPPLMSPAYLSEAETYYLRRLTSGNRGRPEHRVRCPFYREQASQRYREKATAVPREVLEPEGYFLAHRPAPEKLSQAPDDADPDDRSRGVAIPRLARLLWRMTDLAAVNVLDELPPDRGHDRNMAGEFRRFRKAADTLEVAPGIPLARHFYTHIDPFDRSQVFARLRDAAADWPESYAPQAFLLLYALGVSGARVRLAGGRELELRNRIQHVGIHKLGIGAPYLVLVLVGEHNPRDGYDALRGFAQPIHGPGVFMPVGNATERAAIDAILRLQYRLRRRMVALTAKKPVFDVLTKAGPLRPDFVLNLQDHRTGELVEIALTVRSFDQPEHVALKAQQHRSLAELGEAIVLDGDLIQAGAIERSIARRLRIQL